MSDDPDSPSGSEPSTLAIAVTVLTPLWHIALPAAETLVRQAAQAALMVADAAATDPGSSAERAKGDEFEVSLVLADDKLIADLNRDYRGVDRPTNVLAFAAQDNPIPDEGGGLLLGDVILALETIRREAQQQRKALPDHVSHLTVHGVLHLLGYDHQSELEAAKMEHLETVSLARLGIADPHCLAMPSA